MLLRDGPGGPEVLLQRRADTMAFAAGMVVFPGGACRPAESPEAAAVREVAEEVGIALSEAGLRPWVRWVTPEDRPMRFDTRFFIAALPDGAEAVNAGTEAVEIVWRRPADALADHAAGALPMMTPTVLTLRDLVGPADVASVLAAAPEAMPGPRLGFRLPG